MGCDIHSIIQIDKDGWRNVGERLDDDRCYDSFAVLADVRNGRGFAGVKTGEGWDVIFPARGLPPNTVEDERDPMVLTESGKELWLGDHSYSYLNLFEIEAIYRHYVRKNYKSFGVVERSEFERMQREKVAVPANYSSDVSGGGVVFLTPETQLNDTWNYARMSWSQPALDELRTFMNIRKELTLTAEKYGLEPHQVRVVFGFDS